MACARVTGYRHGVNRVHLFVVAGVLLFAGLFVYDRVAPHHAAVLGQPEVRLLGNDPWFHTRHAQATARDWPHLQRYDAHTHYPQGLRTTHVGLYDLGLATAIRVAGAHEDVQAGRRIVAWAPPLLGGLCLLLAAGLAGLLAGRWAALAAAALLWAWPAEYASRAALGFADHHVIEPLLALAALATLSAALARAPSRRALLSGAPLLVFLFSWAGAPVYVGLFGLALGLVLVWAASRGLDTGHTVARWAMGVGGCFAVIVSIWPEAAMDPRGTLPTVAALGVLAVAASLSPRMGRRPGALLLFGVVILGLGALWPPVADRLGDLLGVRSSLVVEHRAADLLALGPALALTGLAGVLGWRQSQPGIVLSAGVALGLTGLWVLTRDFAYAVPPLVAAVGATAPALLPRGRRHVWAALLVGAVAWRAAVPLVPSAGGSLLDGAWSEALTWLRTHTPAPGVPAVGPPDMDLAGTEGVLAGWDYGHLIAAVAGRAPVASHGPHKGAATFFLATDEAAALAALTADCGPGERVRWLLIDVESAYTHVIAHAQQLGRVPADYFELQPVEVAGRTTQEPKPGPAWAQTLGARLWAGHGSGLAQLRLVWQSPQQTLATSMVRPTGQTETRAVPITPETQAIVAPLLAGAAVPSPSGVFFGGRMAPQIRLYEHVVGAVLRGRGQPGEVLTLALRLRTAAGGLVWQRSITVPGSGTWTARVPYPTEGAWTSAVQVEGAYVLLRGGQGVGRVQVPESAINQGALIELGPLR